jgi:hypothetical protein
MHIKFWSGNLKERALLKELRVVRRIIFKFILKKLCGYELESSGSTQRTVMGSYEHEKNPWVP